jgi:type II secretory pathway predicted ATPase ExeA
VGGLINPGSTAGLSPSAPEPPASGGADFNGPLILGAGSRILPGYGAGMGPERSTAQFYEGSFGLRERPFTLVPDPGFLFWSPQHRNAFSVLEFGILGRAPITLITGEIGSGKTTLLQALLQRIEADLTVGLISNAQGGRGELLQWVLNAFGLEIPAAEGYVRQFRALQDFLVAEYAAGRRVLLIVDEAQNLSVEGLEEIRMLTNINANKDELIQLILVGQPELRDIVRQPAMRQLAQRVAASFHLGPMDAPTTAAYVAHRLRVAGGTGCEFTAEALDLVHRHAGGVPRLVNQLCDFAMLYAWSADAPMVTRDTVRGVLDDGVFFGDLARIPQEGRA